MQHNGSGIYLCFREMVIAASRRSVDDHIVYLGWSSAEKEHEAFSIEIRDDTWLPRIELQGNNY